MRAVQNVLGLRIGDTVTVERTPRVDAAIKAGRVAVVYPVWVNGDAHVGG